ncbi:MAG: hypothetical protein LBN30_03630 [Oscillospiraceae bacterium]|nr:hypothetical protein [Oscillospiraceae bacterium]
MKRRVVASNPCGFVRLPAKQRMEYTFYTADQMNALLDAIRDDPLYPLVRVTAVYGLRRSEVLGLKWDAVDFERSLGTDVNT